MSETKATSSTGLRSSIVRFAPSPNGLLHIGHARSALLNWRFARDHDGAFLLRIEDIDTTRARPEFEAAISKDLAWLGLEWHTPIRRQSEHFSDYEAALSELRKLDLIYPAFLSRAEAAARVRDAEAAGETWPRDPDGAPHYPGDERAWTRAQINRRIADGKAYAWRLDMPRALHGLDEPLFWDEFGAGPGRQPARITADPASWGDVILARRDVPSSYHLAVTVDDAIQQVTDVIRGEDLFASTSVDRLLQRLLGLSAPRYRHHKLILDSNGRKLSKSDGATSIASLRDQGARPADIIDMAGLAEAW